LSRGWLLKRRDLKALPEVAVMAFDIEELLLCKRDVEGKGWQGIKEKARKVKSSRR